MQFGTRMQASMLDRIGRPGDCTPNAPRTSRIPRLLGRAKVLGDCPIQKYLWEYLSVRLRSLGSPTTHRNLAAASICVTGADPRSRMTQRVMQKKEATQHRLNGSISKVVAIEQNQTRAAV